MNQNLIEFFKIIGLVGGILGFLFLFGWLLLLDEDNNPEY